jgi:hypothetical protein
MAAADTVAQLLLDAETRPTTLEALEANGGAIDSAIALAAAPALVELLTASADEVNQAQFECVGLLLNRLFMEASADPSVVFGAAHGDGRMAALLRSSDNVAARALRKPAEKLTAADVRSVVLHDTWNAPVGVRGWTKPHAAAELSTLQVFGIFMKEHPLASK